MAQEGIVASFAVTVREQLAQKPPTKSCCQKSLLRGFLEAGEPLMRDDDVWLSLAEGPLVRLLYQIFRQLDWQPSLERMPEGGVLLGAETPRLSVLLAWEEYRRKRCCRRAWLRGVFLRAGSVVDPRKGYHLECSGDETLVGHFRQLVGEEGISGQCYQRGGRWVFYSKRSEDIAALLALLGAHAARLTLEELLIERALNNQIHRQVNYETANLNKAVEAGLAQAEEIRWFKQAGLWETLPVKLRQVAEVREAHPYASLQELCDLIPGHITKSGVNHRLRRLRDIIHKAKAPNGPLA